METCEICESEKSFKTHTFENETLLGKVFSAWVYNCNCPVIAFDALMFFRENNIKLSGNNKLIFEKLYNRKKAWFDSCGIVVYEKDINVYDVAASYWKNSLRKIKKYQELDEKKKEKMKILDRDWEANEIENAMWQFLYKVI